MSLFSCYQDKQSFDIGGGTGTIVTNAFFKHTAKHAYGFNFSHCAYSKFRGTMLEWRDGDLSVLVSDARLDPNLLNEYTDEQCFELIFKHVPTMALVECFAKIAKKEYEKGMANYRKMARALLLGED